MPTFAAALRLEVRKAAVKEVRKALKRLKRIQKQVKALRLASRAHHARVASVQRRLRRLKDRLAARGFRRIAGAAKSGPRVSSRAIRDLRSRLEMTRLRFADLVGVSPGSIFGWETGRTTPRGGSRARLVELKKKSGTRAGRGRARNGKKTARGRSRRGRP